MHNHMRLNKAKKLAERNIQAYTASKLKPTKTTPFQINIYTYLDIKPTPNTLSPKPPNNPTITYTIT